MSDALGMVETRGLVAAIAAADAGLKTADVRLQGTERVDPAMVTVLFSGDVAAVRSAVAAAAAAAAEIGDLIAQHVIPRPNEEIDLLAKIESGNTPQSKKTPQQGINEPEFLEDMTVLRLRRLARQTPGMPLQGREISKANREILIQELARILRK
ncbi:MAG: BMC domain-containing protein [Candidatus Latescibacteria bacterium]|jgi:ethanolamine utilization protein EutM|nr:BMC domain-containing protein [Candidatus Latescibacterota bacterium]